MRELLRIMICVGANNDPLVVERFQKRICLSQQLGKSIALHLLIAIVKSVNCGDISALSRVAILENLHRWNHSRLSKVEREAIGPESFATIRLRH